MKIISLGMETLESPSKINKMQGPDAGAAGADNIWVAIVTILFALSLISERIANLIKLKLPTSRWNLRDRRPERGDEKVREGQILTLALIAGWIVAFISGADLFLLIDKGELLNYDNYKFTPDPRKWTWKPFIGMFLSGFFISMGSKFWHDVLDIVLQFSALKKYKAEKQEIDNRAGTEGSNERGLLPVLLEEYPVILKLKGFVSAKFRGATLELLFVDVPQEADKNYLESVLHEVNYSIQVAPKLHGQ